MADVATASPVPVQILVFTHHAHVGILAEDLGREDVLVTYLEPPAMPLASRTPTEVRAVTAQARTSPAEPIRELVASARVSDMNAAIADRAVDPSDVREWARSQNIPVSARGRMSADLIARYQAAIGSGADPGN